jgi:Holliday junction resolvase RusA-like endonuclease
MIDASKHLKPWRQAVTRAVQLSQAEDYWETTDAPCIVILEFVLARPASVARTYPAVKPDLDKLIRAALDGCTDGHLWTDDSRVISIVASKRYADTEESPGLRIRVTPYE